MVGSVNAHTVDSWCLFTVCRATYRFKTQYSVVFTMKYEKAEKLVAEAESLIGSTVTVVMPQPNGERKGERYELTGSQAFCIGPLKEVETHTRQEEMACKVNAILQKEEGELRKIDKFPLQLVINAIENGEKLFYSYFDRFESD